MPLRDAASCLACSRPGLIGDDEPDERICGGAHTGTPAAERAVARFSRLGEHGGGVAGDRRRRLGARPARGEQRWRRATATVAGDLCAEHRDQAASSAGPGRELPGLPPLTSTPTQLSFPSAHAATSFAGARAVLAAGLPAAAAVRAGGWLAASRLYLGVHYPSDVLAGRAARQRLPRPRSRAMSTRIGIVGMPNAGKSSLFNALTKAGAEAANYPFTTIEPNVAVVPVRDERLEEVAETVGASEIVWDTIDFHDIAGLGRRARTRARGWATASWRTSARPTRSCTSCARTATRT